MKSAAQTRVREPIEGGFTLVELIVVMVIIGIISSVVGLFIGSPINGFVDQARRAALTDAADIALLRMTRDLRGALPNSVRTSSDGSALELLYTLDGERYRIEAPGEEDDRLTPGSPDRAFNTLAPLGGSDGIPAGARLAVYPVGDAGGGSPYSSDVITPVGNSVTRSSADVAGTTESRLTLGADHTFPFDSPSRRVFLVQGAVSYRCAPPQLLRYAGYVPGNDQPISSGDFASLGVNPTVLSEDIGSCDLAYSEDTATGSSRRNAVARLVVVLERNGESIRLLRQVHMDNSP